MIAAFLITLREVIEASLIVATILGILKRLHHRKGVRTVWLATLAAALTSFLLLSGGSLFGVAVQRLYTGRVEQMTEGMLMALSALFITWAVFFLHTYFGRYKTRLLVKIRETTEMEEVSGLFWLTFTAVFREGIEVVLFLTTIFLSSNPLPIMMGSLGGVVGGLLISFGLFLATLRLPIFLAFRVTSGLLIFFAAGLFARGIQEFMEAGIVPELMTVTLRFVPDPHTILGELVRAIFGITRSMDVLQLTLYVTYALCMFWWVFVRKEEARAAVAEEGEN